MATEGSAATAPRLELRPCEYVYRRVQHECHFCGGRGWIELHVGVGGNYRTMYVCENHDREPQHYVITGDPRPA